MYAISYIQYTVYGILVPNSSLDWNRIFEWKMAEVFAVREDEFPIVSSLVRTMYLPVFPLLFVSNASYILSVSIVRCYIFYATNSSVQ